MRTLDLNADVGELSGPWGEAIDADLLAIITSANVACGGHAGDLSSMRRVCDLAVAHGVAVGAQVSYVDREGFGRRPLMVPAATLAAQVEEQIQSLHSMAIASGTVVSYIKPHGALYHAAVRDREVAIVLLQSARNSNLSVLTLPHGHVRREAQNELVQVYAEAFADRAYTSQGGLLSREQAGSVIDDPAVVAERVLRWSNTGLITAHDGTDIEVRADSLCLHGDTAGAVELARHTRASLNHAGVIVRRFTEPA